MKIPTSFQLGGIKVKVKAVKGLRDLDGKVGQALFQEHTIIIDPEGPPAEVEDTFCHELVHFILSKMGEDKLNANEKFVHLFACFLHHSLVSAKGDLLAAKKNQ